MGVAPNYALLVVSLALGGIGVAAFHPQVFSLAGELSGERRSFGLALFIFGGTMGLGLSPLWLPLYAEKIGLHALPLVSIPGLLFAVLLIKFVPLDNPQVKEGGTASNWRLLGRDAGPFGTHHAHRGPALGYGTGIRHVSFAAWRGARSQLGDGGRRFGVYNIAGVIAH